MRDKAHKFSQLQICHEYDYLGLLGRQFKKYNFLVTSEGEWTL